MTETKHTPGPWTENGTAVHAGDKLIAAVYGDDPECKFDARMQANAHLIATVPDLLEAMKNAYRLLGGDCPGAAADVLRAAIQKASAPPTSSREP